MVKHIPSRGPSVHRRSLLLHLLPFAFAGAQSPALVADAGRTIRDSRGGNGRAYHIESAILKETRRINVSFPNSYQRSAADRRYPVTIVLDGEASLPAAAAVSDELTANGQIPEAIIVAIENTNRLRDLTPPGISVSGSGLNEGGDRFLDFIEQELLPAIDRQLRGAAPRTLIGHSSGGLIATYAAATRTTYACVIALDTPTHLGGNWLVKKLVQRARSATGPLRYASYEARFGWTDITWKELTASAPPTWRLHREKLARENHESMPLLGMYLGLREVFSDYSMLAAPVAPTTSILPYYAKVSESLGAPVIPPRKLLGNVREDLLMEGRGAAARIAYATEVAGYGAPSDADDAVARIAEVEKRPPPTETVEGLLATPFPTPEEARAYLGEWTGEIWMNEAELRTGRPPTILRIRVENGRVVGEQMNEPIPGERLVQKLTYLRVTSEGLTWGFMNGMRPRGMLLHVGRLEGGRLTGVMRFGGVDFKYPADMTPPVIQFAFRKK
jgi:pimeloyl-ACP methyl ester carboxylesterase